MANGISYFISSITEVHRLMGLLRSSKSPDFEVTIQQQKEGWMPKFLIFTLL